MMESARNQDWPTVRCIQGQVDRVAALFQRNCTLGQSLAALKAAASSLGLCGPDMLPPREASFVGNR
jgi:4-hydroxy-tetrahydrodipicolinate synthase